MGPLPHVEHELCGLHNSSELFELQLQSVGQSVSRSVGQSVILEKFPYEAKAHIVTACIRI